MVGLVETEEISDELLLTRISKGNAEAFEHLCARYYDRSYSLAYRLCGQQSDAQDIVQETFLRVARNIRAFRSDAKFSSWLYRITINVFHDLLHKRRAEETKRTNLCELPIEHAKNPGADRAREALQILSDGERAAILLTVYEGFNHAEVAKILGCAETTVSWRVFQAKRKLRKFFEHEAR